MTHPVESLSAYLDGELPEAERRAVELHLAACGSCTRHVAELEALDTLARDAPAPDAPAGYFDALPGRVRSRIRGGRRRTLAPAWILPLAAGIVVAVVAPLVLRENAERAPVAEPPVTQAPAPPAPAAAREQGATAAGHPESAGAAERLAESKVGAAQDRALDSLASREATPPPETARARRPAPAAPARADERREGAGARGRDFAVAPPPAGVSDEAKEPYASKEERDDAQAANAADAYSGAVVGGVVGGRPQAKAAQAPAPAAAAESAETTDPGFRAAAGIPLTSAPGARRAVEAWRRFLRDHAGHDEARVRLVEAAAAVYRHTREASDRDLAVREAESYLADPAAPQPARVRAALRALR